MEMDDKITCFAKSGIYHHGRGILPRPALYKKLDAGLDGLATFICAPAGYGKTTLVNGWLKQRGLSFVRLSFLDEKPGFQDLEKRKTVYVFDDCESVQSYDAKRLRLFTYELPQEAHIILISREEIPFSLSSLRMSGALNEIRTLDLKLSDEETAEWFEYFSGMSLSKERQELLVEQTEGWPTAVSLAARSFDPDRHGSVFHFPGLYPYFKNELFTPLAPDLQSFLLKTSLLEWMDPEFCTTVIENENGQVMLEEAEKTHLFLSDVSGHQKGYLKYHPLFAGFLQKEFDRRFDQNEQSALHRKISRGFYDRGYIQEAIGHALKGKDFDRAAYWINLHAPNLFAEGEWGIIRDWLSCFPEPPCELALVCAWTEICAGEYDKAVVCLGALTEKTDEMYAEKAAAEACIAICKRDPEMALERFTEAVRRRNSISRFFRNGMNLCQGEVQLARSRIGMGGRLNKSLGLYLRLKELWKTFELGVLGFGSVVIADTLYEQDQRDEMMDYLMKGIARGAWYDNADILVPIYFVYIRMKWAEGQAHEAWSIFEMIKERVRRLHTADRWMPVLEAIEIRLILLEKDSDESTIMGWFKNNGILAKKPVNFQNEFVTLTYVRVLMERKKFSQASHLLTAWNQEAVRSGRLGSRIEIYILQALIFQKKGSSSKAFDRVYQALLLGEREGYIRSFLDEGAPLAEVLASAIQKDKRFQDNHRIAAYAEKLLSLFDREFGVGHWSKSNRSLMEPLTQRELDILRLIGEGFNNNQIAGRLGIKVGTVKGYVVNLYGKLGVDSRAHAARKAQELGVV